MISAGPKNKQITFQVNTPAADAGLELADDWADGQTRWASMVAGSGSEDVEAARRLEQRQSWRFFVWFDEVTSAVTSADRIKFGTRYFEIVSVAPVDAFNREIVIETVEVVPV